MLQNDLRKLYKWADTNNMKFIANKFELLGYGKEQKIKSATTYKSYDDSNIDNKEQVRDLGIMMCNTATFTLHIRNIVIITQLYRSSALYRRLRCWYNSADV